ncbi:MAG: hypothetical protein H6767_03210 [Candidatus Peribacteria bacterium]|nr:MAG: hypothetical protein H6767_03210 [Candidatus Peribacteria bacterium]
MIRTKDRIERYTKDNLWISGIKDDLLADLPTWMVEIFKEERLTIDIPQWVPLTGSRNSMVNRRYYVELLKPYLYKQVIDFILQSYVHRSVRIPMLPADYYGLERYDFRHSSQILSLAEKYNHSGNKIDFSAEEIDLLKDKENMVQFLVLVNFQRDGETTNLISIKSKLLSGKLDIGKFSGNLGQVLGGAAQDRDRLNAKVEKYNLSDAEVEKETGVTSHQLR